MRSSNSILHESGHLSLVLDAVREGQCHLDLYEAYVPTQPFADTPASIFLLSLRYEAGYLAFLLLVFISIFQRDDAAVALEKSFPRLLRT